MLYLTAIGVVAGFGIAGWRWAIGFLLGALFSYWNFRWLKQLVDSLGESKRPRRRLLVWLALRYALLGIGSYVILRNYPLSLKAALAGLFIAVAAVIWEILFELIYAGT